MNKTIKFTGIGLACALGAIATPTLIHTNVSATVQASHIYDNKTPQQIENAVWTELRHEESNVAHKLSNNDIKRVLQNMFPGDEQKQAHYFGVVTQKLQNTHLGVTQLATQIIHQNAQYQTSYYTPETYNFVDQAQDSYWFENSFQPTYQGTNTHTLHDLELQTVLNAIETQTNRVGHQLSSSQIWQVISTLFHGNIEKTNEFFNIVTK